MRVRRTECASNKWNYIPMETHCIRELLHTQTHIRHILGKVSLCVRFRQCIAWYRMRVLGRDGGGVGFNCVPISAAEHICVCWWVDTHKIQLCKITHRVNLARQKGEGVLDGCGIHGVDGTAYSALDSVSGLHNPENCIQYLRTIVDAMQGWVVQGHA